MTTAAWSGADPVQAVAAASASEADPEELLRRSGRGDEVAFAELYDQTCRRLFGLVLRVVGDPVRAEEVTQEVYVHVWRHSSRFDPGRGSALGWIMTTAHRAAVERVATPRPGTTPVQSVR